MKDQMEVCPLARRVMSPHGSTLIRPITGRRSLSPSSFTRNSVDRALRRVYLRKEENYGLTTFRVVIKRMG
jgi:hypothetical protein